MGVPREPIHPSHLPWRRGHHLPQGRRRGRERVDHRERDPDKRSSGADQVRPSVLSFRLFELKNLSKLRRYRANH